MHRIIGAGAAVLLGLGALAASQTTVQAHDAKPTVAQKVVKKDAGASVQAFGCGSVGSNQDTATGHALSNGVNIRTGPGTSCTSKGYAYTSHTLDYYCFTRDSDAATWTYLKDVTTGVSGWMKDSLLSGYGSTKPC